MTHGEGWRFVQLGKFTERACAVSMLLDAYFAIRPTSRTISTGWRCSPAAPRSSRIARCSPRICSRIGSPSSCSSIPEFPYSVRYSVERMLRLARCHHDRSRASRHAHADRADHRAPALVAGLRARCPELLAGDLHAFLNGVLEQCRDAARGGARRLHRLPDRDRVRKLTADVLRHPPRHPLPLQPPGVAEHDGSADAPAHRVHAALLHVPAVGEPARAHLRVRGPSRATRSITSISRRITAS